MNNVIVTGTAFRFINKITRDQRSFVMH